MKLAEIARRLDCELRGPGDVEIRGVAGIEEAEEDQLTFISNPKYLPRLADTRAGAVILALDGPETEIPRLISRNPYLSFAQAIELFYAPPRPLPGIHPSAAVAETAEIGDNPSIGPNVVVGEGVRVGRNAVLYSGVTIYPHARVGDDFLAHSHAVVREYCRIGDRVVLQNHAVVGADGFGFAPKGEEGFHKIVQSGMVVVEDDVEVGAHSCIDRATVGETRIGRGTKIDNLVQIGHGCRVGRFCLLAAQVGLAGSTRLEDRVTLAGQVGVAGHLTIGEGVVATAQTGVARSVKTGKTISGTPEMDSSLWKRVYVSLHELPELVKKVRRLEKELASLRDEDSSDEV